MSLPGTAAVTILHYDYSAEACRIVRCRIVRCQMTSDRTASDRAANTRALFTTTTRNSIKVVVVVKLIYEVSAITITNYEFSL